ncbi:MAG: type restriction enzyme subunit [Pseudomonadota bacterium]|nr:type restriction enzyme subunit [Pseudomonadota bacterium]
MSKQIPQGYKQTKLGIIPEDWEVVKLHKVAAITGGKRIPKGEFLTTEHTGFPYIRVTDMYMGGVNFESLLFVPKHVAPLIKNYRITSNDLFITVAGTLGIIGKIPNKLNNANLTENANKITVNYGSKNFIFFILSSNLIQTKIKSVSTNNAQPKLALEQIRNFIIPIPPIKEQEKIAEILTTWDDAIAKQEQLIEQKQVFKKGLMQQIFSQKRRFKDDNGNDYPVWQEQRLGEIADISTGQSNREDSSLIGKYTFFDRSQEIRTSDIYLFDGEAIIVAGEGQDFIPKYFIGKFDLHQRTYAIMNLKNLITKYLFYYIYMNRGYFFTQAVGSTVKSLRLPLFQKMPVMLPIIPEQNKIADFITLIDDGITKLSEELEQLKLQKKCLMQKLLTGQVRVRIL